MSLFAGKKILLLGLIVVLLAAIPLTVYFVQRQQEVRTQAQKSTILSFAPPTFPATEGETFNLDVSMNPAQNLVSFVKLDLSYDSTKLATSSAQSTCGDAICPNTSAFPSVLEGPIYSPGKISLTLSVGADPTKVVQSTTKVATITFSAKAATGTSATQVLFGNDTQVLSTATTDQASENVLSTTSPASITIAPGEVTPTPAPVDLTPTPTGTSSASQNAPVCTSLDADKDPTGPPPLSLTFTANGSDSDGTIQKITFNFGDGPVQDILQGGGIGSASASVQIAHTYNTSGTFQASAVVTDDSNATSNPTSCTKTVTVAQAIPPTPTEVPPVTLTPPGPGEVILGVGIAGIVLSVVGAALFFAL